MTKHIPGGLLIVIEGIDGAGKTTLAAGLKAMLLSECGIDAVQSKEPTQGPHGMALRATAATGRLSPEQELAYLVADRRDHVDQLVGPALAAGRTVILDRYFYSNLAYQGAAGMPLATIREANAFAPEPQLVLLLDLPVNVGLSRIAARGDVANAFETAANLQAVRGLFMDVLPVQPVGRILDASQTAEAVLKDAFTRVVYAIADRFRESQGFTPTAAEQVRSLLYDKTVA